VLNVKSVSGSIVFGDAVVDVMMISEVDPLPITTTDAPTDDVPFVVLEFMSEYDAAFGDERAEDVVDDHPVPELSNGDKVLLQRA
jgi:hypothetical protein